MQEHWHHEVFVCSQAFRINAGLVSLSIDHCFLQVLTKSPFTNQPTIETIASNINMVAKKTAKREVM